MRSSRKQGQLAYTVQLVGVVNGSSRSTQLPCCPLIVSLTEEEIVEEEEEDEEEL